jgi:hypothetical protein
MNMKKTLLFAVLALALAAGRAKSPPLLFGGGGREAFLLRPAAFLFFTRLFPQGRFQGGMRI